MADVLGFFKKVMPFLTTGLSLAGPPGILASTILGKVLNVSSPTTDAVQKTLNSLTLTPELQAQLQEAEMQYKQQMQAMGYQHEEELAQLAVQDRADARQMQVQVKSWVPSTLAVLVTLGFFGLIFLMMYHKLPDGSNDLIDTMIGSLGTAWIMVVSYYFGSSVGSDRKTELIAQGGNGNGKLKQPGS